MDLSVLYELKNHCLIDNKRRTCKIIKDFTGENFELNWVIDLYIFTWLIIKDVFIGNNKNLRTFS